MLPYRVLWFALILLFPIGIMGQSTFGSITGNVADPSGAVVPGAQVQVISQDTGAVRTVSTTSAGVFNVPNLDLGTYRVRISAHGFTTFERADLHLLANQIINITAQLKLGGTSTVVQVQGATPVISTETSDVSGSMTHQAIEALPLVSRHTGDQGIYGYTVFNTGVATTPGNSLLVINGARLETGVLPTMDGIAVMAYPQGAGPVQPGMQDVQEVKVEHSVAPAEFATAGNIQVISKAGTNQYHGGVFYDYTGSALDTRTFFSSTVPFDVYNNFGGNFGGPIIKDKLFFFADYEGSRDSGAFTNVESVPLPAWRQGNFSSLLPSTQLVNPLTGVLYAGNIIPPGSISTVSQNIQSYAYPLPNTGPAGTTANNWRDNFPQINGFDKYDNYDVRVDYNLSAKDTIFGHGNYRRLPDSLPGGSYGGVYPLTYYQVRYGRSGVIAWSHVFSSAVVNEFRFGATFHRNNYGSLEVGNKLLNQFGITGVPTTLAWGADPNFNISGVTPWSPDAGCVNYEDNPEPTFEWIDNLSWSRGRHFLKFGFDAVRDHLGGNNVDGTVYGTYNFTGVYTGFGYADFLLGIPQTTNLSIPNPSRNLRGTTWGLYAQDQFKASSRLTLNYGVRWELMPPYTDRHGLLYTFDPATGGLVIPDNAVSRINPFFPTNIPIETASKAGYPANSLIDMRWNNIEPRIGFAYKLFGGDTTVVRGGYGIYTNLVYQPLARFQMSGGPYSGSVEYINSITNGVPLFSFPSPFLSNGMTSTQDVNGVNPHLKTPYTQEWNLSIEHQIRQVGFRISYLGSRSVELIYNRNLNEPAPSATPFSTSERPFPIYNNIFYADSGGNEFYNALEISAQKKYGQNLTFNAGWTWARGLTDTQDDNGEGTVFGGQVIQNQFDRAVEKSNDGFTLPQRFFTYALYTLPFGQGQRFLGGAHGPVQQVLGGWRTTWAFIAQSGLWFTPTFDGFDPSNTATFGGRPDRIGSGQLSSGQRSIDNWFNTAAFKIPGCPDTNPVCNNPANVGTFGNSGFDILSGPSLWDLDFGLEKNFKVGERMLLTFTTTMVDALNHPKFNQPDADISDVGSVGTIGAVARLGLGAPASRQIDFGLRLDF